jgi:hypothetical protein
MRTDGYASGGQGVARGTGLARMNANSPIEVTIPIRTHSGDNARTHWRTRAARVKRQRTATALLLLSGGVATARAWPGWLVVLTRVAPRQLDAHDGLPSSLKAVADEVARQLGLVSDRDSRLNWAYGQERGKPREYAVRVRIEARE